MSLQEQFNDLQAVTKLAVVIPCYKVKSTIDAVLDAIPEEVDFVYCVDDGCPEKSGQYIEQNRSDTRIKVLYNEQNQGVGGAMQTGYGRAISDSAQIIVKIDGDGQMDPRLLRNFVDPIIRGEADYTKGNRFFWVRDTERMPKVRIFGNGILSFFSKLSSGYWNVFDPTNGYTAIHAEVLRKLPYRNVNKGYFFESDMLYQLGLVRAVVQDVPMTAHYEEEESNLSIRKIIFPFLGGHAKNLMRRLVYMYFLRDFHLASIELLFGVLFFFYGLIFAGLKWYQSVASGTPATAGAVMIGALFIIVGIQMLLGAVNYDIQNVPRNAIHGQLRSVRLSSLDNQVLHPQPSSTSTQ